MPLYLVTLSDGAIGPFVGGAKSRIVHGSTSADALAACKSSCNFDSDAAWAAATVTEIAAGATLEGVEIRAMLPSNVDAYIRPYSFVGLANAKLSDLLAGLAAVISLDTTNYPTTVTSSANVLTIPAGNNVGDLVITCALYLNNIAFASIVSAVSATGSKASSRTITLSGGSLAGIRWNVTIADPTNPMDLSVYSHALETIDLLAARLVVLMDAHALIGGGGKVTYGGSNTITIAGATAAQGAKVITMTVTRTGATLPELACTVNAAGISSVDRTIIFPVDGTLPVPQPPRVISSVNVA